MSWRGTTRNVIQSERVHGKAFLYDTSTEQGCKPGGRCGARRAERRARDGSVAPTFRCDTDFPDVETPVTGKHESILFSSPVIPCLPSFLPFLSPFLSPSVSSLIGYIFKVRTRRLSGALPRSPLGRASSQSSDIRTSLIGPGSPLSFKPTVLPENVLSSSETHLKCSYKEKSL